MISKSRFAAGLQCSKRLWFEINSRDQVPAYGAETLAIFEQGHEVGRLAQGLFPGGIEIPRDELDWAAAVAATQQALANRLPLYEAAFVFEGAGCRVDLLVPVENGNWDLVEVKSSTSQKPEHVDDISFQAWVLRGAGVPIRRSFLCRINNEYIRRGSLDLRALFAFDDLTGVVENKLAALSDTVQRLRRLAQLGSPPEIAIGPHCSKPYGCPLESVCWAEIPEESVFSLYRGGKKSWDLFHSGIVDLTQIPENVALTDRQAIQVATARRGEAHVSRDSIRQFLAKLRYPIHYFDLETFAAAVPQFDGTRPYQQIPFQYSIHQLDTRDSNARAGSFLAETTSDPRRGLFDALRAEIGPAGSIVAFNADFERRCLRELAALDPAHGAWVADAESRFVDLLAPFRDFEYYHPKQLGSASLKAVLPVVTERGYEGLAIQEGQAAAREYLRSLRGDTPAAERVRIRASLVEYCGRDTEGMLEIVRALEREVA